MKTEFSMDNIICVVLAAGEGTRMKSTLPKVLHPICGRPMIEYLIESINSIGVRKIIVVVGHKADLVKKNLQGVKFVTQDKLLGTGDAVSRTKKLILKDTKIDAVMVLYGDVPLLSRTTLKKILDRHFATRAGCTLLTSHLKNPTGYGRILRGSNNKIVKVIEELEASIYEKVIEEINVGVYCFSKTALFDSLGKTKTANRKNEKYLTDAIEILAKSNIAIDSVSTDDPEEFLGVNTRNDLMRAGKVLNKRIISRLIDKGVTVIDPDNTYIEEGVQIKKDTIIYPYTFIEKGVRIGPGCSIGPLARLRSGTVLADEASIGNFVEIVRSSIGSRTKIRHKCYIGDTVIGKDVNVGAGTIIANYDGKRKHKTVIEDSCFIGTGTILIAPVKIGKGATTGAGSVITKNKNVPAGKTVVGVPARILRKKQR